MNENERVQDLIILVDQEDREIGISDKVSVHEKGNLHRAFSLFVFNSKGEVLIQKRALEKYHSPGLWTNTCCSHPRPGELTADAVKRRLNEEMGLSCEPEFQFSFTYRFEFENGLIEHEFDHVYFGHSEELPVPDPSEVMDWKYISIDDLEKVVHIKPEHFTIWLQICLPKVLSQYRSKSTSEII